MPLTLTLDELMHYTAGERERWRLWFERHPGAVDAPVHAAGRFTTVGKLIDHIFLVEQRHLQRLTGAPVAQSTGLTGNNAPPLFSYGSSVRRELEGFAEELDPETADDVRTIEVRDRPWPMTPRKLLFHIMLHEIRHWAQVALAVRLAGYEPPGDHDLFFSNALR